jgi:hypothetical protein
VPEPGWIELNTTMNVMRGDPKSVALPLIDANVGYVFPVLHLNCQLKLEAPLLQLDKQPTDQSYHRVIGDSAVGSKCVVYSNEKKGYAFDVYPEYDWTNNGVTQHFRIPLIAEKEWKYASITGNIAYNKGIGTAKNYVDGGAGVGARVSKRNAVFVGGYVTGQDGTKWIEVGFRRRFGNSNLNLSYSHTVGNTPYLSPDHKETTGQAVSFSWQFNKDLKQLFHRSKKDPGQN